MAVRACSSAMPWPSDSDPAGRLPPVTVLGIPRTFIAQDKPDHILARFGLDGPGLAQSVREAMASARVSPTGDELS